MDLVKTAVTRNLLCWAAGQAMFCRHCQNVMDWKTTVIVGKQVLCQSCFLKISNDAIRAGRITAEQVFSSDVTMASNLHRDDEGCIVVGCRVIE